MSDQTLTKSIQMGKKDGLLIAWLSLARSSWDHGVGFLIKYALKTYIEKGSFVCIGHVHFSETSCKNLPEKDSISVWLGDAPDILSWMDDLKKQNLKTSKVIKEVLKKSLKLVPDSEPEWIPTFFDIERALMSDEPMAIPKKDPPLVEMNESVETHIPISIPPRQTVQRNDYPATDKNEKEIADKTPVQPASRKTASGRHAARAMSLSGSHYKDVIKK